MQRIHRNIFAGVAAGLISLATPAQAGNALDDATILAIFDQTNTVDIWTGRLGAKYGHSDDVRALGKSVATEHEAVQLMGRDLAKKLGIVPTPPAADSSAKKHADTVALLQSKTGRDFDAAYLRNEVAFHQSVIDAVKKTLLPAIQNAELRELVERILPGFEHHLAETKATADKLGVKY